MGHRSHGWYCGRDPGSLLARRHAGPKARPRVVDGRAYTPAKTKGYEESIAVTAREAMIEHDVELTDAAVRAELEFHIPMPKSWSKKRKAEHNDAPSHAETGS